MSIKYGLLVALGLGVFHQDTADAGKKRYFCQPQVRYCQPAATVCPSLPGPCAPCAAAPALAPNMVRVEIPEEYTVMVPRTITRTLPGGRTVTETQMVPETRQRTRSVIVERSVADAIAAQARSQAPQIEDLQKDLNDAVIKFNSQIGTIDQKQVVLEQRVEKVEKKQADPSQPENK